MRANARGYDLGDDEPMPDGPWQFGADSLLRLECRLRRLAAAGGNLRQAVAADAKTCALVDKLARWLERGFKVK